MQKFISFKNVDKEYITGDVKTYALKNVSFSINKGEFCIIVGESGAGKTTLLNILGGMDNLTDGKVIVDGEDISTYNKYEKGSRKLNNEVVRKIAEYYNIKVSDILD